MQTPYTILRQFLRSISAAAFQVCFFLGVVIFFAHYLFSGDKEAGLGFLKIMNAHEHVISGAAALRYAAEAGKEKITRTVLLGSPEATLVPGQTGFRHTDENNLEVLELAARFPAQFIAVPTLDPADPAKLEKLKDYVHLGAHGLKLYGGHQFFHQTALNDAGMDEVYRYCEAHRLPVVMHVNTGLYLEEFEQVLRAHPSLPVVCPHFCLSVSNLERLERLMKTYPNLYLDTSFGFIDFLKEAMVRITLQSAQFRDFVTRYQDRILFGTDLVVTNEAYKTPAWMASMLRAYRSMLEQKEYSFQEIPGMVLRGLNLDWPVLKKIYSENGKKLFDAPLKV